MRVEAIPAWIAGTNAYLAIGDDNTAVLVDAPPDPRPIGEHIASRGVAVVGILLTHGHVDHTGGAGQLAASTGAGVWAHPDDDFLTLHPEEQVRLMYGQLLPGSYEVPGEFQRLAHGQLLELAGLSLEVRHTPGHTPGHCCFYDKAEGVLFSGDQLFRGSVGRADLPGGSWPDLMTSMRQHVMTLDDDVRVFPGHGPETTIGAERRTNPFRDEWV